MDMVSKHPITLGVWNEDRQAEDEGETGSDWLITQPTIGPASPLRPGKRSSKDVQRGLGLGLPSLAAQLCWRLPPRRVRR